MPTPTKEELDDIENKISLLIVEAYVMGITFTVEDISVMPPRMGAKLSSIDVRPMTPAHYRQTTDYLAWGDVQDENRKG